jgi:hypothetical protein
MLNKPTFLNTDPYHVVVFQQLLISQRSNKNTYYACSFSTTTLRPEVRRSGVRQRIPLFSYHFKIKGVSERVAIILLFEIYKWKDNDNQEEKK